MGCGECRLLLAEYDRLTRDYNVKLQALNSAWETAREYRKLKNDADEARINAEDARYALESHQLSHAEQTEVLIRESHGS